MKTSKAKRTFAKCGNTYAASAFATRTGFICKWCKGGDKVSPTLREAAQWVGLTEDDMNLLVEQARKVPEYSPCPDYNTRLLMLADFKLREKNGGKA